MKKQGSQYIYLFEEGEMTLLEFLKYHNHTAENKVLQRVRSRLRRGVIRTAELLKPPMTPRQKSRASSWSLDHAGWLSAKGRPDPIPNKHKVN